jgi:hypothetical protein
METLFHEEHLYLFHVVFFDELFALPATNLNLTRPKFES